jgi:deoxyribose-phosphate aldolase
MNVSPGADLAPYIQHTLIRPGTTADELRAHCHEAVAFGFDAAMVAACWAGLAREVLAGSAVKLASAVDFPLGCMTTAGKIAEARALADAGVDQIDIGVRVSHLRSGRAHEFRDDIAAVVEAVDIPVKVMLELALLDRSQQEMAVDLAVDAGASWVKNASSGAVGVATPADIAFLRQRAPSHVGVKASGGIKTAAQVRQLLAAGADLVGTSSGLAIIGTGPEAAGTY